MAARKKGSKSRKTQASKKSASKKAGKKAARAKARPAKRTKPAAKKSAGKKPAARKSAAKKSAPKKPAAKKPAAKRAAPAPALDVMAMNATNGRPAVSAIGITHHHSDYTSHDVEGVRRFYTEVLGLGNSLYMPEHGYLTVFLSPRSSLGFMAPMEGAPPDSWSPPGEPNIYLFVEDVDRAYNDLTAKGVSFDMAPTDMPWGHRMAVCRDPEGRRVCLARNLQR